MGANHANNDDVRLLPPPSIVSLSEANPDAGGQAMSFQLGSRDANGILMGSFDQGWRSQPIDIVSHIVPFLYPCAECQSLRLHVVGTQQTGVGIKLPFARRNLISTGRGYQAICNSCTNISSVLPKEVVQQLENGIISAQICAMYAGVSDPPEPYTQGFLERFLASNQGASEKLLAYLKTILGHYRREVA